MLAGQGGPRTKTSMNHFLLSGPGQLHDLHTKLHLEYPEVSSKKDSITQSGESGTRKQAQLHGVVGWGLCPTVPQYAAYSLIPVLLPANCHGQCGQLSAIISARCKLSSTYPASVNSPPAISLSCPIFQTSRPATVAGFSISTAKLPPAHVCDARPQSSPPVKYYLPQ